MWYQVIIILFIHWLADFVCQTHEMSINKSKSNKWLFYHVAVYSSIWLFSGIVFCFNIVYVLFFTGITFLAHFLTDYATSRITSRLYSEKRYHDFFVVIGVDQLLHYLQLISLYEYFINI